MKMLICGLGSIGQRHARVLLAMGGHELAALRSRPDALPMPGVRDLYEWAAVDAWRPDAAIVATPTAQHMPYALACAERRLPLFLEKPVAASMEQVASLCRLVARDHVPTYVGYVLRFHPVIRALKEALNGVPVLHASIRCTSWLPAWRPGVAVHDTYSARRDAGGGAVLDVSHEFDYAAFLFGEVTQISGRHGRCAHVTIDAEDYYDAHVVCAGTPVQIHVNLFSPVTERLIVVETNAGRYVTDLVAGRLSLRGATSWERTFTVARDDCYRAQLEYFLANVANPSMMNNLCEAAPLFEQIVAFREQSL